MLTDEFLPQPFRFLNQIVRDVVEEAIDHAMVREISMTKLKRLRVPREMVKLSLMVESQSSPTRSSGNKQQLIGIGGATAADSTSNAETEEKAPTVKTTTTTNATASNVAKQSSGSSSCCCATAGNAGATVVFARNGTYFARDETLPDDDGADDGGTLTAPVPGTVGDITTMAVSPPPIAPGQNPSANIVGCLPFAPGEEVVASCIGSSTGTVVVATALVGSSSANPASSSSPTGGNNPSPFSPVGQQAPQSSSSSSPNHDGTGGGSTGAAAAAATGGADTFFSSSTSLGLNGGRLLVFNSVAPVERGMPRRCAISKLAQQPDHAVLLPAGFVASRIEVSSDDTYIALATSSVRGGDVLVYRKTQQQDCFSVTPKDVAAAATANSILLTGAAATAQQQGSTGASGGNAAAGTSNAAGGSNSCAGVNGVKVQLPPACDTTLVLLGCVNPPSYAAGSSSINPSSVAPMPLFLFRPRESREAFALPVVSHTLFIAWCGYNVFSTMSLSPQLEFGGSEIMRGHPVDYTNVAQAAVSHAVAAVTPPQIATVTTMTMSSCRKPPTGDGGSNPPVSSVAAGAAGPSSTTTLPATKVVPPLPALIPLLSSGIGGGGSGSGGSNNNSAVYHRPLPQLITTAALCPRSSRVALGLTEGVVGVWTQHPPCFSTITVAAPHRSDAVKPTRRPMVVTSVSFFQESHVVAALCVPVQIKSLDDMPSVQYSRVIVVELATGTVSASVPHVPSLSLATTLGDLPLILLFGNKCFWVANLWTGELLAEIPCGVSTVANALSPPPTVAGDALISFCNSLQMATHACPVTASLYATVNTNSSSSPAAHCVRIDGVSVAAGLRPLLNRRDDIVRAYRSVGQVAALVDAVLNPATSAAAAAAGGGMMLMMGGGGGGGLGTLGTSKRAGRGGRVAMRINDSGSAVGGAAGAATSSGDELEQSQQHQRGSTCGSSSYNNYNNNLAAGLSTRSVGAPTQTNIGDATSVAGMTHSGRTAALSTASPTAFGGGAGGATTAVPNELVTMPTAEISQRLAVGRAERARKVNRLLDDLLGSAASLNNVVAN